MILIEQITPDNWREYKEIRLKSLQGDPQAFGSTYEAELQFSEEKWKERSTNKNTITLVAKEGKELVGIVGAHWENYEKTKHIAHIWGMFVDKDYRGQGIGKMLMEEIERRAKQRGQTKKIKLEVVVKQEVALEMYKKLGYRLVGKQEKQLRSGDVYMDSYLMEKLL